MVGIDSELSALYDITNGQNAKPHIVEHFLKIEEDKRCKRVHSTQESNLCPCVFAHRHKCIQLEYLKMLTKNKVKQSWSLTFMEGNRECRACKHFLNCEESKQTHDLCLSTVPNAINVYISTTDGITSVLKKLKTVAYLK